VVGTATIRLWPVPQVLWGASPQTPLVPAIHQARLVSLVLVLVLALALAVMHRVRLAKTLTSHQCRGRPDADAHVAMLAIGIHLPEWMPSSCPVSWLRTGLASHGCGPHLNHIRR